MDTILLYNEDTTIPQDTADTRKEVECVLEEVISILELESTAKVHSSYQRKELISIISNAVVDGERIEIEINKENSDLENEFEESSAFSILPMDFWNFVWEEAKKYIEKSSLRKAKIKHNEWIRYRKSLASIIEENLKEYSELFELATAVRLQFEFEKQLWQESNRRELFYLESTSEDIEISSQENIAKKRKFQVPFK